MTKSRSTHQPRPGARRALFAALALPALLVAASLSAKTLVYCSEGSPENFYPGVNTTGTSFDANSQIYSRIVDFERGGTTVVPGPRREVGDFARRQGLYVPPAQGREMAQPPRLEADARLQRRRHDLRDRAAVEGIQSVLQGHEPEPLVLHGHGHAQVDQVGGPGQRLHGPDHAREARGALPVESGDGVRRRAVEGIRGRDAQGRHAREDRPGTDRHRPVLSRPLHQGRHPPLQGLPAILWRQGEDRRPDLLDHAGRLGALGQAAEGRMPCDALPQSGRSRHDPQGQERRRARAARPQRRLSRLQHARRSRSTTCGCARRSTWRSTRRRSSTPCTSRLA